MGIADPSRSFVGSTIPAIAASSILLLIVVDNADEGGAASFLSVTPFTRNIANDTIVVNTKPQPSFTLPYFIIL